MNNPGFSVEYDFSLTDFRTLTRHLVSRARPVTSKIGAYWIASVFFASVLLGLLGVEVASTSFLVGALAAASLIGAQAFLYQAQSARRCSPMQGGFLLCRHKISLDAQFVILETPLCSDKIRWFPALVVEQTTTHIFIVFDVAAACCIPRTAFPDTAAAAQFIEFAKNRVAATTTVPPQS